MNILSATVSTTNDRLALSRFVFEMGDIVHLDRVLNAVRRIDAVYDVYRVTSPEPTASRAPLSRARATAAHAREAA